MVENPDEDTEPYVQRLFIGSLWETVVWSQDLAGVGFSVYMSLLLANLSASLFFMEQQNPMKSDVRKKPVPKYLLIIVLVIIGVNIFIFSNLSSPAPSSSTTSNASPIEYAGIYAQMQISPLLKSPSTAKFPRSYVEDLGGGLYKISSYVDSQNSYGAMIRSNWESTMKYSGVNADEASSWKTEKIIFDGKVVYQAK